MWWGGGKREKKDEGERETIASHSNNGKKKGLRPVLAPVRRKLGSHRQKKKAGNVAIVPV